MSLVAFSCRHQTYCLLKKCVSVRAWWTDATLLMGVIYSFPENPEELRQNHWLQHLHHKVTSSNIISFILKLLMLELVILWYWCWNRLFYHVLEDLEESFKLHWLIVSHPVIVLCRMYKIASLKQTDYMEDQKCDDQYMDSQQLWAEQHHCKLCTMWFCKWKFLGTKLEISWLQFLISHPRWICYEHVLKFPTISTFSHNFEIFA